VESVTADAAANTVVVAGTADAQALKERIEYRTKKPVQIVSAGGAAAKPSPPPAAEHKKSPEKSGGGGEEKTNPDKGGGADKGDKAGAHSQPQPREEFKQPPEEKKPVEVGTQGAILSPRNTLPCPLLPTTPTDLSN
jgi:hypothetical protein